MSAISVETQSPEALAAGEVRTVLRYSGQILRAATLYIKRTVAAGSFIVKVRRTRRFRWGNGTECAESRTFVSGATADQVIDLVFDTEGRASAFLYAHQLEVEITATSNAQTFLVALDGETVQ